jgi:succinate dehydrogenase / fumarate reductase membrane anchor subunit
MSLRHPLARVKGLGVSGEGSHHWWLQRITALALIPLSLWFMFSVVDHLGDDLESVTAWIARPYIAVLFLFYLGIMFYHGMLGMQVILEDYIHAEGIRVATIMLTKAVLLVAAIASIFAVLTIAL